MKQVLQNFKTGDLRVEEVPPPLLRDGFVLVRNQYSLISSGTEAGTVKLGQMSLLGKARARPEQVRKVFDLARSEGWLAAYEAATRSLEMPMVLGYCCAGTVVDVGRGVDDVRRGDRVACGGGGYAVHAEIVSVPRNLCVAVPQNVSLRSAAFTTLGSIAMQSLRVADVRLGENIVVVGLGLVGLLVVQLLRAAGANVFGIDTDPERARFTEEHGLCPSLPRTAGNLLERVRQFTGGYGADAVIVTAATANNDPVALAGDLCRYKGRVVVVGRTEMNAPRETYLFKELELRTSLAYGPGTGDPTYEERGQDYPFGYVRWTENRNMASFVGLIDKGSVAVETLITHQFEIAEAKRAFDVVTGQTGERSLAVLLHYPETQEDAAAARIQVATSSAPVVRARVGVVGAGSFATNFMVPILAQIAGIELRAIASATGVRARALADKYRFGYCATDAEQILGDPDIDCVFILTRHDTHAPLTLRALEQGKHVFVEKPLALDQSALDAVVEAQARSGRNVVVGFNRRYAPLAIKLRDFFAGRGQPMSIVYRANVGYRPPQHWLHDPLQGGGVIAGEACHFIDFCRWLTGAPLIEVHTTELTGRSKDFINADNVHINLTFADGSVATVAYLSNGSSRYARERIEVFADNATGVIEDFGTLTLARGSGRRASSRLWFKASKGHRELVEVFLEAVAAGRTLDLFAEQVDSMRATLTAANRLSRISGQAGE